MTHLKSEVAERMFDSHRATSNQLFFSV